MISLRVDTGECASEIFDNIIKSLKSLSKIKNTPCFVSDILFGKLGAHPHHSDIKYLMMNVNMCRNKSEQDMREIGCLSKKCLYHAQH